MKKPFATFAAALMAALSSLLVTPGSASADSTWAVVDSVGQLVRGKQVLSVSRLQVEGTYEVTFKRDVTKCGYVATLGAPTTGFPGVGFAVVSSKENNARGVFVSTFDADGLRVSRSFHLKVFC